MRGVGRCPGKPVLLWPKVWPETHGFAASACHLFRGYRCDTIVLPGVSHSSDVRRIKVAIRGVTTLATTGATPLPWWFKADAECETHQVATLGCYPSAPCQLTQRTRDDA